MESEGERRKCKIKERRNELVMSCSLNGCGGWGVGSERSWVGLVAGPPRQTVGAQVSGSSSDLIAHFSPEDCGPCDGAHNCRLQHKTIPLMIMAA